MSVTKKDIGIQSCAIIGCGNVGATVAYSLMQSGLLTRLLLIDINQSKAEGEAEDIAHALPFNSPLEIHAGKYEDIGDCGIIIICAGANQLPGQTRIDLLNQNASIFRQIVENIKKYNQDAILLVVTNPVDILTEITLQYSSYPQNRVIGSGTVLDTARLKEILGKHLGVDSRNIHAFIIGEHGDSELALWSSANVSGIDLDSFCHKNKIKFTEEIREAICEDIRKSAYKIIEAKGATYYAIADSVRRIVTAIIKDEHTILPVSARLDGQYDINGICLGVPCIIGKEGIIKIPEVRLNESEKQKLSYSANLIKEIIQDMKINT